MSENKRYSAKRILGSLLWALLGLAIVVLLGAAMNLKNSKRCKGANINIVGVQANCFIDKKEITNTLETIAGGGLKGKQLSSFNLSSIENILEKNQWIKSAELYFDNNEILRVNVTEREPVARIFTSAGSSFYIDTALARLPLSDKFSARVPMFTNFSANTNALTKADTNLLKDIKNLSNYILKDAFWMAQIDQVDITANRTFEMIPKIGNQVIAFGNADNYEQKFNKLLTFYKEVETKVGWNKYSKIDVEYNNQIVAVKRGAEDIIQDSLRTKQIMQMLVANAQKAANDSINNIQLEQPKDENNIPVAAQIDNLPNEQTTAVKPIDATPNIIPPSTEKPTPNLSVNPAPPKVIAPEKPIVPEKAFSHLDTKPFWYPSAAIKPSLRKQILVKDNSTSHEKPNPIPLKKTIVLKSSAKKLAVKPPVKTIKPIKKPTIKPTAKPKVEAPANDY